MLRQRRNGTRDPQTEESTEHGPQAPGKAAREAGKPGVQQRGEMADPLGQGQLRAMLTRLGLILLGCVGSCSGRSRRSCRRRGNQIVIGLAVVLTGAAVAVVVWTLRQAKTARGVASILSNVSTDEDRKAALQKLSTDFKKGDTAAIFARAQLELQEDPKKALATLESIDLSQGDGSGGRRSARPNAP